MKCLDTSVLIDILRNKPRVHGLVMGLDERRDYHTTCINRFELLAGAFMIGERRAERAKLLLSRFEVLEFDTRSVEEAARIWSGARLRGREIPMRDAMVAGMTKVNEMELVTSDKRHFKDVKGLKVKVID